MIELNNPLGNIAHKATDCYYACYYITRIVMFQTCVITKRMAS